MLSLRNQFAQNVLITLANTSNFSSWSFVRMFQWRSRELDSAGCDHPESLPCNCKSASNFQQSSLHPVSSSQSACQCEVNTLFSILFAHHHLLLVIA
ncbi:hypothetical protein Tco_0088601 [Tanacetum coccineum]